MTPDRAALRATAGERVAFDPLLLGNMPFVGASTVLALLDALDAAEAEVARLRAVEVDTIAVLSATWPTTTVPWIAETGVAACVSLLASERDTALNEAEQSAVDTRAAARDANDRLDKVRALCDEAGYPKSHEPHPWGYVSADELRRALDGAP